MLDTVCLDDLNIIKRIHEGRVMKENYETSGVE